MKIPGGKFQRGTLFFKASTLCKGYFGSKERVADIVLEKVPRGAVFVEPFCGGASLSYIFKKHKRRILCGDASYYAYLHAAGLIAQNEKISLESIEIGDITPCSGYATTHIASRKKLPFDPTWVDGYCVQFADDTPRLLALGFVLDKLRAAGHFPIWTNQPITTRELVTRINKTSSMLCKDIVVEAFDAEAYYGPAHETLASVESFENGYLYLDPAWPFTDGKDAGAFYQFPANLGAILEQRVSLLTFLDTKEHLEYILSLVRTFKDKNGTAALVATQSTNSPSPKVVAERLKEFGKVTLEQQRVQGGNYKTGFVEYLMEVKFT